MRLYITSGIANKGFSSLQNSVPYLKVCNGGCGCSPPSLTGHTAKRYAQTKNGNEKISQMMRNKISILIVIICFCTSCKKDNIVLEQDANFSDDYISDHKDKYFIEIPEVYELAHIIMAVKYQNSNYNYFIQKNTSYFQTVIKSFSSFKSLELFKNFAYTETDFINNYSFRENSYRYTFESEQIFSKNIYLKKYWEPNIFEKHLNEIQNFSDQSDFLNFYSNHYEYYESQIALFDSLIPVQDMWSWLESQFSTEYDCYKILISPLTTGSHSTQRYITNNFKESIMFISGLNKEIYSFDTLNILLNMRYLFTEIDHNYVNPISEKYNTELNSAMKDLSVWKKNSEINELYYNAYKIFNEYMTWAVYDLYILERYPDKWFQLGNERTIKKMVNDRGFIKFKEFEDYLINIYINRTENEKIEDLYPQILEWMNGIN